MNKIRISNLQVFMCLVGASIAYGHFVYTGLVFQAAGRDAWFCLLLAAFIGSCILYLHLKLASTFPQQSLVQFTLNVYGRWLGSAVASLYILFFLLVASLTVAELSIYMELIYPRTPRLFFLVLEFLLVAWVIRGGAESVSRVIQILMPVLVALGLTAFILSLKDKDPSKLLPLLDHSLLQMTHGTLIYVAMICDMIVLCMYYSEVDEVRKLPKQGFRVIVILFFMFLGPATGPIMIFGEKLASALPYPTYVEIQYINIAGIFERMDIVGVILWTMGAYIRASIYVLGASKGIAHLFKSQSESLYVFPVVVLVLGMSLSILPSSREEIHQFLYTNYPILALFVGLVLPLATILLVRLRGKGKFRVGGMAKQH